MHNWNEYRGQVLSGVGEVAKLSPDTVKGYATIGGAGAKTGHRRIMFMAVRIKK